MSGECDAQSGEGTNEHLLALLFEGGEPSFLDGHCRGRQLGHSHSPSERITVWQSRVRDQESFVRRLGRNSAADVEFGLLPLARVLLPPPLPASPSKSLLPLIS